MSDGDPWSNDTYNRVTRKRIASGKAFQYTKTTKANRRWEAHDDLKVLKDRGDGVKIPVTRESRDSARYPVTTPIVVGFDVTGSMGTNPAILQRELKGLMGIIDRNGVVSGPQIAIAAYGDTNGDAVPLQLSQFECNNLIDENLDNVFLEGRGQGNGGETSTALAYFIAKHVVTDAWDKRRKKGYMFLIGDECALPVSADASVRFLGETEPHTITPEEAFAAAAERWNIYFLVVDTLDAYRQHSFEKYCKLLGVKHVIPLESTESAPAIIATIIALSEGTMAKSEVKGHLVDAGFSNKTAIEAVNATKNIAEKVGGNGSLSIDTRYADLGL